MSPPRRRGRGVPARRPEAALRARPAGVHPPQRRFRTWRRSGFGLRVNLQGVRAHRPAARGQPFFFQEPDAGSPSQRSTTRLLLVFLGLWGWRRQLPSTGAGAPAACSAPAVAVPSTPAKSPPGLAVSTSARPGQSRSLRPGCKESGTHSRSRSSLCGPRGTWRGRAGCRGRPIAPTCLPGLPKSLSRGFRCSPVPRRPLWQIGEASFLFCSVKSKSQGRERASVTLAAQARGAASSHMQLSGG